MTQKQINDKFNREQKKRIEKILHPNPVFNGIEVCHSHGRNKIVFQADPDKAKSVSFGKRVELSKARILGYPDRETFLKDYSKDLKWLTA